jgi:anaphase-promoting complex subunit 10
LCKHCAPSNRKRDNLPSTMDDDEAVNVDVDDDEQGDEEVDEEAEGDGAGGEGEGGNDAAGGSSEPVLLIRAVSNLDSLYGLREIGREALCWQLSSAKPGNGVEQIRDQSTDTYWQSDGTSQPHWIQVHFARRVAISHVCLYLDYNLDESYTPKHLSIQVGMTTQDLVPAIYPVNTVIELNEPVGWCIIPLTAPPDPLDDDEEIVSSATEMSKRIVRTHLIQISVISMHQNGRDTHIRQVQLYGPRTAAMVPTFQKESSDPDMSTNDLKRRNCDEEFSTVAMSQFSVIR